MLHKAWNSKGEMPYCFPRSSIKFQGHTVQNITDFDPNWAFPDYRPVAAFKSVRFALLVIEIPVCLKTTKIKHKSFHLYQLFSKAAHKKRWSDHIVILYFVLHYKLQLSHCMIIFDVTLHREFDWSQLWFFFLGNPWTPYIIFGTMYSCW